MEIFYCYVSFPEGNQHVWSLTALDVAPGHLCISLGCADGLKLARATFSSQYLSGEGGFSVAVLVEELVGNSVDTVGMLQKFMAKLANQLKYGSHILPTSTARPGSDQFQVVFCRVSEQNQQVSPGLIWFGNDFRRIFNNKFHGVGVVWILRIKRLRARVEENKFRSDQRSHWISRGGFSIFSAGLKSIFKPNQNHQNRYPKHLQVDFGAW